MKIAVACDGLTVSKHAALCSNFSCYDVDLGIITDFRNLPNSNVAGSSIVSLLGALKFDTLITGGIDMDTAESLCHAGIEVVAGVNGTAREVVEAYISHTLMGAKELCGGACPTDEGEIDVDAAFDRIYESLKAAV